MHLVTDLKAFVPAPNFDLSLFFYRTIGFDVKWQTTQLAEIEAGKFRFLLQKFDQINFAKNFMMHLMVNDVDQVYREIKKSLEGANFVGHITPPKEESWGLKVSYLTDPAGVLWHICKS